MRVWLLPYIALVGLAMACGGHARSAPTTTPISDVRPAAAILHLTPTPTPFPAPLVASPSTGPVLVDVQNDRALFLQQPGEDEYIYGVFSANGRWFFYSRRKEGALQSGTFAVDLDAAQLAATRISDAAIVSASADGSVLSLTRVQAGKLRAIVRLADRSEIDVGPGGGGVVSPDGLWVLLGCPSQRGDPNTAAYCLYNTQNHESRYVEDIMPSHRVPSWSSDSKRVAYGGVSGGVHTFDVDDGSISVGPTAMSAPSITPHPGHTSLSTGDALCPGGFSVTDLTDHSFLRCMQAFLLGYSGAPSPDGRMHAFIRKRSSTTGALLKDMDAAWPAVVSNDLVVYDYATDTEHVVLQNALCSMFCLKWSPEPLFAF